MLLKEAAVVAVKHVPLPHPDHLIGPVGDASKVEVHVFAGQLPQILLAGLALYCYIISAGSTTFRKHVWHERGIRQGA